MHLSNANPTARLYTQHVIMYEARSAIIITLDWIGDGKDSIIDRPIGHSRWYQYSVFAIDAEVQQIYTLRWLQGGKQ